MKRVIKPQQAEEAVYYSDFTGQCFGSHGPSVTIRMSFDYGSVYDGADVKLHLTDQEAEEVMAFIKSKLSEDAKAEFKKTVYNYQRNCDDAIQARDITQSTYFSNNSIVLKRLVE